MQLPSLVETQALLALVARGCHQRTVEQIGRACRCWPFLDEAIRRRNAGCGERPRCQNSRQRYREKNIHRLLCRPTCTYLLTNGTNLSRQRERERGITWFRRSRCCNPTAERRYSSTAVVQSRQRLFEQHRRQHDNIPGFGLDWHWEMCPSGGYLERMPVGSASWTYLLSVSTLVGLHLPPPPRRTGRRPMRTKRIQQSADYRCKQHYQKHLRSTNRAATARQTLPVWRQETDEKHSEDKRSKRSTFSRKVSPQGNGPWCQMPHTISLKVAARNGSRHLGQRLVGVGAEIMDALHGALRGGHPDVANDLLENGAPVAAKDSGWQYSSPRCCERWES